MKFSRDNKVVSLCIQGMSSEEAGQVAEAQTFFLQAWNDAANDHEKFLAAYHISRLKEDPTEQIKWLATTLEICVKISDPSVDPALPFLYSRMAEYHESLNSLDDAAKFREMASLSRNSPQDTGPFYHGTRAALQVGDLLSAGNLSNYEPDIVMNHIYFTALVDGVGLAAALAKGDGPERVYVVAPTGPFEDDPNVTNKKFPGNPTRSYRSEAPLRIISELSEWERPEDEVVRAWRERLMKSEGKIIN